MRLTQKTVKTIAKAYGFMATWHSDVKEWSIRPVGMSREAAYYTSDHDDAIYTLLAMYRYLRDRNKFVSMSEALSER